MGLDLASLGSALASKRTDKRRAAIATPTIEGQPSGPRTGAMSRLAESMNI